VRHRYDGEDVLRGVSLEVAQGESVALTGPNGAGKTTLARMTMGLVRPREGRVTVGDWDVASRKPHQMAARVGYAFQHADLQLFARTVREDVAFGPRRLGRGDASVDELLAELRLDRVAHRHPYDLPPPLRKLVSLAGVVALEPGVLVLDEPTAGMGKDLRDVVVAALERRLAAGVTVIAISHDRALVGAVAMREVVLEGGVVVANRAVG
jgi:energy-coupling factor transport system ATP-binding protein